MIEAHVTVQWEWSAHARRVLTLAALCLLLGVAAGRPAVTAAASAPLAVLLLAPRRNSGDTLEVHVTRADECFEREPLPIDVRVTSPRPAAIMTAAIRSGPMAKDARTVVTRLDSASVDLAGEFSMLRWGRRRLGTLIVDSYQLAGLRRAHTELDLGEIAVYPRPTPMRHLSVAATRPDLAGEHVSARPGPGIEFARIRPFTAGDTVARIHWPASLRAQQLLVTETAAEMAVDVVVVIDAFTDVGAAGVSSLDATVRGATGVTRAALRTHDRVGVVALGGWLRWLRADVGERQFYRVAAAMLDVIGRESFVDPNLDRITAAAIPPGSVVIMFTALLDDRAVAAVHTLRARRYPVTVVDVLTSRPAAHLPSEEVARRLWQLRQRLTVSDFARMGVAVVSWDGDTPLDALIGGALRIATAGRR